jgi:3-hydroxyacyl-[acyl-carrier protein] dehydratase/trans-2-decenoyl-[acyl-carrier protein] isomerase
MVTRQSSYNYDEILACGRGELFGPGYAQLPAPPMLMFNRITEISRERVERTARAWSAPSSTSTRSLWFFQCHFIGDPVMPGCLGVDAVWQMLGFYLCWDGSPGKGRALGCGEVKFSGQITNDVKLVEYGIDLKRVMKSKLVLGIADGWVKADGQIIYEMSGLRVGLFT